MRDWITRFFIILATLLVSSPVIRAGEAEKASPDVLISNIDKVGATAVLQDMLADTNKPRLDEVLSGIRSGDEKWLVVLSKLRPTLMASLPAMQFDRAASEALENNPRDVLKSATIINREWAKLAHTTEQDINYPGRICGVVSADWDEDTPRAELATKAIPRLKKRQKLVMGLSSQDVSDGIKNSCLEKITGSLEQWEKNRKQ
jgi:hypothetical protein